MDLKKNVEETKENIVKKNDETMISKADGQVVDDMAERLDSLDRNFEIMKVKLESMENENLILKKSLRTQQIEAEERELEFTRKVKDLTEEKLMPKKTVQEFSMDKELGIYQGMGEIKKLDYKLDKFIEHHSIKQKRVEKRLEKIEDNLDMIKNNSIRNSRVELETELNAAGDDSIGLIESKRNSKASRPKIIDPMNPSDIEKILEDCAVLKRDIRSLTEVQRSLALVRKLS